MPGLWDLLPQPPWIGPPIPRKKVVRFPPRARTYALQWARYMGPISRRHHPLVESSFKRTIGMNATELERNLVTFSSPTCREQISLFFYTLDVYVVLATDWEALYPGQVKALMLVLEPYMMRYSKEMEESHRFFKEMSPEEEAKAIFTFGSREEFVKRSKDISERIIKYYHKAREEDSIASWRIALDSLMNLHHIYGTVLDGALEALSWEGDAEGYYNEEELVSDLGDAVNLILDDLRRGVKWKFRR